MKFSEYLDNINTHTLNLNERTIPTFKQVYNDYFNKDEFTNYFNRNLKDPNVEIIDYDINDTGKPGYFKLWFKIELDTVLCDVKCIFDTEYNFRDVKIKPVSINLPNDIELTGTKKPILNDLKYIFAYLEKAESALRHYCSQYHLKEMMWGKEPYKTYY